MIQFSVQEEGVDDSCGPDSLCSVNCCVTNRWEGRCQRLRWERFVARKMVW